MVRFSHIPKQYTQFRSTRNEFLSYKGPRININLASSAFRVHYCYPHEMLFKTTQEILERPWHPFKILLQKKWDEASTAGLWVFYTCGTSVGQKAVIRRYQTRRLRHALRIALKDRGLDGKGIPMDNEDGTLIESPIKGSLMITANPGVNEESFEGLVSGFSAVLDKIFKRRGGKR